MRPSALHLRFARRPSYWNGNRGLKRMNYLFTMKDAKSDLGVPPEPEDARP
jgi:hypothetical protein